MDVRQHASCMNVCGCCGEQFIKKSKGYVRSSIQKKFKGSESVANVLQSFYNITVTPEKQVYLCNTCSSLVTNVPNKYTQYKDAEAKFRKVRLPGSYISQKIPTTPSSSVGRKRVRISTPKKIVFSPNPAKFKKSNKVEKVIIYI